jgi:hypothetical protein
MPVQSAWPEGFNTQAPLGRDYVSPALFVMNKRNPPLALPLTARMA